MTTIKAIEARVRRKLKNEGQSLKKQRGAFAPLSELGEYFITDTRHNAVLSKDVDLLALAKELKVLRPGEKIEK